MALAALMAGADGIMLEVHNHPEEALSDGAQSLYFDQFKSLTAKLKLVSDVLGKSLDLENEKIFS